MTAIKPRTLPKLRRGEGSIWWDEKRRQVVLEHRIDGTVHRERGDTVADVFELRDARRDEIAAAAELMAAGVVDITVAELLAQWREFDCAGAPMTLQTIDNSIRHITARLGDQLVREVRVVDVEKMYGVLARAGLGKASLQKIRVHLAAAFEFAVRREYVTANVVRSSRLPRNAAAPKRASWLDRDGFGLMRQHLLARPSTTNTALLTVLLAGLRPGEVLGLRWEHIDLDSALVTVQTALQASHGGRRHTVVDTLKTDAAHRTVQLPADLVTALRREKVAQAERQLSARSWAQPALVFATANGQHLSPSNLRRACHAACDAIGVAVLSPHKLRHTFASVALDVGLAAPAVARVLGHADGQMLARTYGHAMDVLVPTGDALDQLTS